MELIVVASPHTILYEPEKINRMFAEGLDYFFLRKPKLRKSDLVDIIGQIDSEHHAKMFLHKHFFVAATKKMGGILIDRDLRYSIFFRWIQLPILKLIHPQIKIATNVKHHRSINHLPSFVDVVLLNDVVDKQKPSEFSANLDLDILKTKLDSTDKKIFAYGNLTEENAEMVAQFAFAGIALQGAVWRNPEPVKAMRQFKQLIAKGNVQLNVRQIRHAK